MFDDEPYENWEKIGIFVSVIFVIMILIISL